MRIKAFVMAVAFMNSVLSYNIGTIFIPPTPDKTIAIEMIEPQAPKTKLEIVNYIYIPNLSEKNVCKQISILEKYIESLYEKVLNYDIRLYLEVRIEEEKITQIIREYQKDLDKYKKQREEYPVATQIWYFFKEELGWNDAVCAGVLGNLMAEAGGQTLKIQWNIYDTQKDYYGICQWSKLYCPEVMGVSLEKQLDYIKNTVEETFDVWGRCYKTNFTYKDFISLSNPKEAALAFAKCYERCNKRHYSVRLKNATVAYDYYIR